MSSRPSSARNGRSQAKTASGRNSASGVRKDLLSREEEYKRLNAELEKRTASLVKEAEAVINRQESVEEPSGNAHALSSLLHNVSTDDFLDDWDDDPGAAVTKPKVSRKVPSATSRRPPRPVSGMRKSKTNIATSAVSMQESILTEFNDLQSAVDDIESKMSEGTTKDIPDDVMPAAAQEMSSDAQIRFLKAKARVMQEEMERLSDELTHEKEENNNLTSRIKELEDERKKLSRTNATQQGSLEKYKKAADDAKSKSEFLDSQLSALKKELDGVKRSQKQQQATQGAADVRLNRALEDVDKYKQQLAKAKEQTKNTSESDKQKIDRLLADNKRLEKQKGELMSGFKKQLKLIDILKRQKMHIEAAKMLSFTEEEFVKALEWGN
ncbi:testis-expressed protein 9-like [Watersipora subatra]|uniref:testis-expressed protein 9-like n=1 Tax=Watersipora subatra TaxID=2589382 RepID=UPI00355C7332